MAIAYRASGTFVEANATTSGVIGLPAGLANGDILVLVLQSRGTGNTVTTPAGYTLAATVNITASHRLSVFYKYVTNAAGETGPNVTQSVSGAIRGRLSAFSGGHATTQLDVAAVTDRNTSIATFAAPSITPVSTGAMVCWCFSSGDDNTLGSHTQGTVAFSSDGTAGTDGSIALVYELQGSPAASGTTSMTESANGPDNWNVITIALRPAAVAATAPATDLFDGIDLDVDIAFGSGPFTPDPTWTRVTDYLDRDSDISIPTGRDSEFSDVQPSTLQLTLLNGLQEDGRRFDPDYTAGPYYGQLTPGTPIRVWSRRAGVTNYHFTGHIHAWPQDYLQGTGSKVTLNATDLSAILARTPLPATALSVAILADSPSPYYPMQEDQLPTCVDAAGSGWDTRYGSDKVEVVDSPLRGEPQQKAKGIIETGGAENFIITATGPDIDLAYTVETWFKIDSLNTTLAIALGSVDTFGVGVSSTNAFVSLVAGTVEFDGGVVNTITATLLDATGATAATIQMPFSLRVTHQLAAVLDSTATTWTVYLDGRAISSATVSAFSFESGTVFSSGINVGTDENCDLKVAHVAVFDIELSATRILAHWYAGAVGGYNETAADRMEALAEFAGLTDAGLYDGATLKANTYLERADYGGSVLDAMRTIMTSEQGRMFVDGSGVLTAQGRVVDWGTTMATHVTSQATFGDDPATEYRFEDIHREPASTDLLRNIIQVSGTATITARDEASVTRHGPANDSVNVTLSSPHDAYNLGLARLRRYATPQARIDRLVVNLRGQSSDSDIDDTQDLMLAMELGWRLTATIRPADGLGSPITQIVTVEGITHTITRDTWTAELYLVPAHDSYTEHPWFIVGDATYGRVGASAGNLIPR
jgi:hypothetical protein